MKFYFIRLGDKSIVVHNEGRKEHWEKIYSTKQPEEVSWTQDNPKTSLDFIHSFNLSKQAKIIDIGGGDSKLVDKLLAEGFENITVLDISDKALQRAKARLRLSADKVNWVVSDVIAYNPDKKYDVWHDRAAFHFLTTSAQIEKYLQVASASLNKYGFLTIGTFSENGPKKCSGLEVRQYSEETLQDQFKESFSKINCIEEDHKTPFGTYQNFLFCSFRKN